MSRKILTLAMTLAIAGPCCAWPDTPCTLCESIGELRERLMKRSHVDAVIMVEDIVSVPHEAITAAQVLFRGSSCSLRTVEVRIQELFRSLRSDPQRTIDVAAENRIADTVRSFRFEIGICGVQNRSQSHRELAATRTPLTPAHAGAPQQVTIVTLHPGLVGFHCTRKLVTEFACIRRIASNSPLFWL